MHRYLPYEVSKNIIHGRHGSVTASADMVSALYVAGVVRPVGAIYIDDSSESYVTIQDWVSVDGRI